IAQLLVPPLHTIREFGIEGANKFHGRRLAITEVILTRLGRRDGIQDVSAGVVTQTGDVITRIRQRFIEALLKSFKFTIPENTLAAAIVVIKTNGVAVGR